MTYRVVCAAPAQSASESPQTRTSAFRGMCALVPPRTEPRSAVAAAFNPSGVITRDTAAMICNVIMLMKSPRQHWHMAHRSVRSIPTRRRLARRGLAGPSASCESDGWPPAILRVDERRLRQRPARVRATAQLSFPSGGQSNAPGWTLNLSARGSCSSCPARAPCLQRPRRARSSRTSLSR